MNKKLTAVFSLLIILAFIGYIIYDASTSPGESDNTSVLSDTTYEENWKIERTYHVPEGTLSSVAVSPGGMIVLGGDSFVKSVDNDLKDRWYLETEEKITALSVSGDTVFASTPETILVIAPEGKLLAEWGPYEGNSLITSVSTTMKHVAIADAGNKRVFLLDKNGEVQSMIGQSDEKFVIPSPYFDADITDNLMFAANTGNRRIETWSTGSRKISEFGEPGTSPGAFCGCCNPAHFAVIPQGFVTAEKGINRIKILDQNGDFVEFVSSQNNFTESIPLDVASSDGKIIYAANSADNTLYIFVRK